MFWWPEARWCIVDWASDSRPYLTCLEQPSYVVRGAGAKALGELFFGCHKKAPSAGAPLVSDVMRFIQTCEQKTAGIAGPFLQGGHWGIEDWGPFGHGFDFRSWFLDTLRTSSREPSLPHMQSLEFYAHEFFYKDAAAIKEMLLMGREYLAVMTATEDPEVISILEPLLQEMANSENPKIARAIRAYLEGWFSHDGLEFMDPEVEGD